MNNHISLSRNLFATGNSEIRKKKEFISFCYENFKCKRRRRGRELASTLWWTQPGVALTLLSTPLYPQSPPLSVWATCEQRLFRQHNMAHLMSPLCDDFVSFWGLPWWVC